MSDAADACVLHPLTAASHHCSRCGRLLCADCAGALPCCGACAGAVVPLGEEAPPHWADRLADVELPAGADDLASALTLHVVVPAALVGMVYSLLYYLLLVRSLFLGGSRALQWIGFCFVAATVLIARYGSTRRDIATRRLYTGVMAAATVMAVFSRAAPGEAPALSLLLLGGAWLYATRVTLALSLEGDGERAERSPVPAIAVLGVVALVAFAVGEPFLLNAPPEVTVRAVLAMIGFLMSAAVTLAAASAADAVRRTLRARGDIVMGVVPARVGLVVVLALAVLAVALAVPGVRLTGSGRIQLAPDGVFDPRRMSLGVTDRGGQLTDVLTRGYPWGWLSGLESMAAEGGSFGLTVLTWLQRGGAVIFVLVVLGVVGLAVARRDRLVARLAPLLRGKLAALRARLWSLMPGGGTRSAAPAPAASGDPFAGLDELGRGPARRAVVDLYRRWLLLLESLGHGRPAATTPHELLRTLPARLADLDGPLDEITGLYVRAAYSAEPIAPADRDAALERLRGLRGRGGSPVS